MLSSRPRYRPADARLSFLRRLQLALTLLSGTAGGLFGLILLSAPEEGSFALSLGTGLSLALFTSTAAFLAWAVTGTFVERPYEKPG